MKPGFVSYIRTLLTIIFLSWGVIPGFSPVVTFLEMEEIRQQYNSPCLRWLLIAMPFLERLLRQ